MVVENNSGRTIHTGGVDPALRAAARDLQKIILKQIVESSPIVLIGEFAMARLNGISDPARVQFLTAEPIEDLERRVSRLARNYKVIAVKYTLNIPDDFQIVKHTIYLTGAREQVAVADVFNSPAYELIPYSCVNSVRVANPWVILRFLFIDIWVLRLVAHISKVDAATTAARVSAVLARCDLLRTYIAKDLAATFQFDYVGNYVNESVAKKKLIKELGERFPTFYPARGAN